MTCNVQANAGWIVQFGGDDDMLCPPSEQRFVAEKLQSEFVELEGRGHFMDWHMPEVAEAVQKKMNETSQVSRNDSVR